MSALETGTTTLRFEYAAMVAGGLGAEEGAEELAKEAAWV